MAPVPALDQLRRQLDRLFAPLLAPGALPSGWRLEERETEQGVSLVFRRARQTFRVELEAADEARPCYARTARFNVYFGALPAGRRELVADEHALLDTVLSAVRAGEDALPLPHTGEPATKTEVREVQVERLLVREGPGAYYANPYVGCMIGCPYCYAIHRADTSRQLAGLPPAKWGRWLEVKTNAAEILADEVQRLPPGRVRLSPIVTDPYQPIERHYRITRSLLEVFAGTRFTPVVLTRAALVAEDATLLARCHDAAVGMSVPTDDDAVRRHFEPAADPIEKRVETLARLREAGLRTFAFIQPVLPQAPQRLVELLAPHVTAVRLSPLVERRRAAPLFQLAGRSEMQDPKWERRAAEELRDGFLRRGVLVNPSGPAWDFLS